MKHYFIKGEFTAVPDKEQAYFYLKVNNLNEIEQKINKIKKDRGLHRAERYKILEQTKINEKDQNGN